MWLIREIKFVEMMKYYLNEKQSPSRRHSCHLSHYVSNIEQDIDLEELTEK